MSLYLKSWRIMNGCKILMDARSFSIGFYRPNIILETIPSKYVLPQF